MGHNVCYLHCCLCLSQKHIRFIHNAFIIKTTIFNKKRYKIVIIIIIFPFPTKKTFNTLQSNPIGTKTISG